MLIANVHSNGAIAFFVNNFGNNLVPYWWINYTPRFHLFFSLVVNYSSIPAFKRKKTGMSPTQL